VVVLPVAIAYCDKSRFRSCAAVHVGTAVPVARWTPAYRRDGPAAVRGLTAELAGRLEACAPPAPPAGCTRRPRRTRVVDDALALAAAPLAVAGAAFHLVPFLVMRHLGGRPANVSIQATVKLLGCVASFTTLYAVAGYVAGTVFGAPWGPVTVLAAPAGGASAIGWMDRLSRRRRRATRGPIS